MQEIANAAYLEGFPFPALLSVAPYCVPGGIRMGDSYSLTSGPMAKTRDLLQSHNPPIPVSRSYHTLQNQLIYAKFLAISCRSILGVAV